MTEGWRTSIRIAPVPAIATLAKSPLISHDMLPGPPHEAEVAGLAAVDGRLVVAAARLLDLVDEGLPVALEPAVRRSR